MLVAFDRPEPTFRHEANPLYKAQREAAPDILRQQMGLVREVLAALNVTSSNSPAGKPTTSWPRSPSRQRRGSRRRDRHRRSRQLPTGARPAREGALQQARRQRLRAVRRSGHRGEDRRHARAVSAVRRAARRPQRQPRRHSRRGGEDGGQAAESVRQPRWHLRPRHRADAEAAVRR